MVADVAMRNARRGPAAWPRLALCYRSSSLSRWAVPLLRKAAADHVADRYSGHQRPGTRCIEVVRLLRGHEHSGDYSDHRPELGGQERGLGLLASSDPCARCLDAAVVGRCHVLPMEPSFVVSDESAQPGSGVNACACAFRLGLMWIRSHSGSQQAPRRWLRPSGHQRFRGGWAASGETTRRAIVMRRCGGSRTPGHERP